MLLAYSSGTATAAPESRVSQAAGPRSLSHRDASSVRSIKAYVRTLGIEPDQFVIQRGKRNYAGPTCPGAGWNCTTAANVVQVTTAGSLATAASATRRRDENRAVCATGRDDDDDDDGDDRDFGFARFGINQPDPPQPPPPLEPPPLIGCQIVQLAPLGKARNVATCVQVTVDPGIRGSCDITQVNVRGANVTRVRQSFTQSTLADQPAFELFNQFGEQRSNVVQTNEKGDNRADVAQRMRQHIGFGIDAGPAPCCIQQAQQSSALEQSNVRGKNTAEISQRYRQNMNRLATLAGDFQGGAQESNHKQEAATGRQKLDLEETYSQELEAPNAVSGLLAQNAQCLFCLFGGTEGLEGEIVQNSAGVSTANVVQHGVQRVSSAPGALQFQFDPFLCCMIQTGNPANRARIDQRLSQFSTALPEFLARGGQLEGNCTTSGNCTVRERLNQNGVTTERTGSGADVHISITDRPCPPFCVGPPLP